MELGGACFGVLALFWPVCYLSRRGKGGRRRDWSQLFSLGCCCVFLWDQLLFRAHLAAEHSVSAWQDTAGGVDLVTGFFLLAVLLLNGLVRCLDLELERSEE